MASVPELLSVYQHADALVEAEDALDRIAAMAPSVDLSLGDYYDALAEVAGEEGDSALAVRAQRRAIDHGCENLELAQEMLVWYLLTADKRDEGEAAIAKLRGERVGDPQIVSILANARMDSGDGQGALEAYDEALNLTKSNGDHAWIDHLRGERQYCRFEHGLPPDEDDRLAEGAIPAYPKAMHYSVACFPQEQIGAALAGHPWPRTFAIQMSTAKPSRPAYGTC